MMSAPSSTRSSNAASSSRSSGPTRPPKEPLMPVSWESIANDHILGIAPYEPGKPIEELERELGLTDVIKLASNENPLPPSERVLKAISEALAHLNRYPDGSAHYLRVALARRLGITPEHIIMGNGSNELIELLVRAFLRPGEEAIIPHPSFVVYPMIVQACGGIRVVVTLKDHRLDLEAMARAITPMTKVVFIANPNNPTATLVTTEEVAAFMARVPDKVIVVFDEAYFEFAQGPDFPDSVQYMKQGREPGRAAGGLRDSGPRLRRPVEPDPGALQRQLAGPGGRAGSPRGRLAHSGVPADERGRTALPVRRVHLHGTQIRALSGQFYSSGCRPERERRLPAAPEGGRDRAAHVELRHGDGAPRDHRYAGGEPAPDQGAEEGPGGGQGRVIRRLAIVGLGLLGGSVAKAARAESLALEIVGIGRNPARLEPALGVGAVDRITTDLREGLAGADMVVLATPVATLERQMAAVWEAAPPQALITDVGSTKAAIVRVAESLSARKPLDFVGS